MVGHSIDQLRKIADETVDLVVTSPPYWGLRDYKTEPVVFGGDLSCEHQWADIMSYKRRSNDDTDPESKQATNEGANNRDIPIEFTTCNTCGAWQGQLGLEPSPELFVDHLVEIFEECRRVLKPSGNLWVNLGDSYMRKASYTKEGQEGLQKHRDAVSHVRPNTLPEGYKEKDLVGLPWLFAFAARRAGWYLRNDVVWAKSISGPHYRGGVCMPEPVQDRCTRSHEFFFHFAKSKRYYYDIQAYAEPLADDDEEGGVSRNMRTVWHFNPQPFPGAHFAVFPKHLIEPIVRASTSEYGCCGDCGVPWVRYPVIEGYGLPDWRPDCECNGTIKKQEIEIAGRLYQGDWREDAEARDGIIERGAGGNTGLLELSGKWGGNSEGEYTGVSTKDYTSHGAEDASEVKARILDNLTKTKTKNIKIYHSGISMEDHPVVPPVVLDPFSGTATSGIVALEHGRSYIGIELNPEYAELSLRRLKQERVGMTIKKYREEAVSLKEYW